MDNFKNVFLLYIFDVYFKFQIHNFLYQFNVKSEPSWYHICFSAIFARTLLHFCVVACLFFQQVSASSKNIYEISLFDMNFSCLNSHKYTWITMYFYIICDGMFDIENKDSSSYSSFSGTHKTNVTLRSLEKIFCYVFHSCYNISNTMRLICIIEVQYNMFSQSK